MQRRSLPTSLSGRDLACMARTGSGKTLAFVLPVLENLLQVRAESPGPGPGRGGGIRAVILSPTRELAL